MTIHSSLKVGGIILCGGKSERMGQPKLSLPFGDELMLQRVVRILAEIVCPIIVVAAGDQQLPELPTEVQIAYDEVNHLGPLGGMSAGLDVLEGQADAAFISGCDTPLLQPTFVQFMIDSLESYELAVPREENFFHPLAAVYRVHLQQKIKDLVATNRMRPLFLIEESHSNRVDVQQLRTVDPELNSLKNINNQDDYQSALQQCGFG